MRTLTLSCLTLLSLFLIGCQESTEPPVEPEVPSAGNAVTTPEESTDEMTPAPAGQTEETDEPDGEVTLEVKSWDELQAFVKQQTGKVVVVDFWATYCAPCLREMPNLIELHQEHGEDVVCVTVSVDYLGLEDEPVESYREPVMEILNRMQATCTNVLLSTDSDTVYEEKFQSIGVQRSSIPLILVYSPQGDLITTFPKPGGPVEFTYQEDIVPLVLNMVNPG